MKISRAPFGNAERGRGYTVQRISAHRANIFAECADFFAGRQSFLCGVRRNAQNFDV